MKNEIKNVSLSFYCTKDWNTLRTVDEQKRFCASCQHNVVDFTRSSETQLATELKASTRVCGRFKRSQMSESFLKYAASLVVASAVSMSCSLTEEPNQQQETLLVIEEEVEMEMEDYGFMEIVVHIPDSLESKGAVPMRESTDSVAVSKEDSF